MKSKSSSSSSQTQNTEDKRTAGASGGITVGSGASATSALGGEEGSFAIGQASSLTIERVDQEILAEGAMLLEGILEGVKESQEQTQGFLAGVTEDTQAFLADVTDKAFVAATSADERNTRLAFTATGLVVVAVIFFMTNPGFLRIG